jgi:hypothetical protein
MPPDFHLESLSGMNFRLRIEWIREKIFNKTLGSHGEEESFERSLAGEGRRCPPPSDRFLGILSERARV